MSLDRVLITAAIYNEIEQTIGKMPAETGGMIGMHNHDVISAYYYDSSSNIGTNFYSPDTAACEKIVNESWSHQGIMICGFVHSHYKVFQPSSSDIMYATTIFQYLSATGALLSDIFYVLIASSNDSNLPFHIHAYCLYPALNDIRLKSVQLVII